MVHISADLRDLIWLYRNRGHVHEVGCRTTALVFSVSSSEIPTKLGGMDVI